MCSALMRWCPFCSIAQSRRTDFRQRSPSMPKASPFDPDLVRELATLLAETDLTEIEVEKGDLRIRVARTITASVTVPMAPPAGMPLPIPAPPPTSTTPVETAAKGPHPGAVTSPMVGTAYRKPSPEAKAF